MNYSYEYSPLGTAGSAKNMANYFEDTFTVIQGDNTTNIDLGKILEFHKEKGGATAIALKGVLNHHHFGIIEF